MDRPGINGPCDWCGGHHPGKCPDADEPEEEEEE